MINPHRRSRSNLYRRADHRLSMRYHSAYLDNGVRIEASTTTNGIIRDIRIHRFIWDDLRNRFSFNTLVLLTRAQTDSNYPVAKHLLEFLRA